MSGSDNKKYSIKLISEYINASIVGDDGLEIDNIATLDNAVQGCVTFLSNSKYNKLLDSTKASAVIVKEGIKTNNETTLLILLLQNYQSFLVMKLISLMVLFKIVSLFIIL